MDISKIMIKYRSRGKKKGWFGESGRHADASRGIKTGRKHSKKYQRDYFSKQYVPSYPHKFPFLDNTRMA